MSENTPTPAAEDGGPVKRDMKAIKAAAAGKASPKAAKTNDGGAAGKARKKQAVQDTAPSTPLPAAEEKPLELIHTPIPQGALKPGERWLVYLGAQDEYLCYRDHAPLLFQKQAWSNGWPVAKVREAFGNHLIEVAVLKTKSDGSRRLPEDFEDMFAFFEDLNGRRRTEAGRSRRASQARA